MNNDEIKDLPLDFFVGLVRTFPSQTVRISGITIEPVTYKWEQFDSEAIVKAMKSIVRNLEK